MELTVTAKLRDEYTDNIIGYIVMNTVNSVAITLAKANELALSCASYMEFADVPEIKVVTYKNHYGVLSDAIFYVDEYTDDNYTALPDGNICLRGNVFPSFKYMELDNEVAIQRCLIDSERER